MPQPFSKWILQQLGWRIIHPDPMPRQYIVAVVPHTSNWDFPLGLLVRSAMGEDIKFIGKSSLFRWPFGGLFRWLGGYPVDRSRRTNFTEAVAEIFQREPDFRIAIAPEGTRSKVDKLKTGFYYIAKEAGVPLILCAFDYGKKEVRFGEPFYPTDDAEADFAFIHDYWKGVRGRNVARSFSPD
jgi:1-acyl-sn-glycerol-3-phosphate acyltransferase